MQADGDMRVIDARGHRCPTPTLKLRRAAAESGPGVRIKLVCDDPMAKIDVPHFAAAVGLEILEVSEADGVLTFVVFTGQKPEARRTAGGNDAPPGFPPDR